MMAVWKRNLPNSASCTIRGETGSQGGNNPRLGVIAQEVEQAFPEAVGRAGGFIPNIYEWADGRLDRQGSIKLTPSANAMSLIAIQSKIQVGVDERTHEVRVLDKDETSCWIEACSRLGTAWRRLHLWYLYRRHADCGPRQNVHAQYGCHSSAPKKGCHAQKWA